MTIAVAEDHAAFEPKEHARGYQLKSDRARFRAPFPAQYRASGVLLHVTSLPSRYGIGDVGPSAFAWVDQLVAAGQSWWQVLPLGPTGFGHSPYQALTSFAANPLIISPDQLVEEGLLDTADLNGCSFRSDYVDFEKVMPFKKRLLARAWKNFRSGSHAELGEVFEQFCEEKGAIQDDAALFMALRARFQGAPFQEWPADLVRRDPRALANARRELAESINQFRFGQFLVLRHWQILKNYANERGVRLLGDLPIFVSPDSSDAWANPEVFLLDDRSKPRVVAGVPPDYFSAQGQLWGNPLYNWEALRQAGYRWWIERLRARLDYLDAIRIDHFRGFEAAWHVPAGAATAASGQWIPGPGADFLEKVESALDGLPLLAEDLGVITPAVTALRDQFHLPGMRVLQFAFNGDPNNPHLPRHCVHNSVVYTGTHDNDTTRGWYDGLTEHERGHLWNYLQSPPGEAAEVPWEMIRLASSSAAALAITPYQDLLGLASSARMNIPGRAEGQWRWRRPGDEAGNESAFRRLSDLTSACKRLPPRSSPVG
jgi:4-alpha-glucanotransferase